MYQTVNQATHIEHNTSCPKCSNSDAGPVFLVLDEFVEVGAKLHTHIHKSKTHLVVVLLVLLLVVVLVLVVLLVLLVLLLVVLVLVVLVLLFDVSQKLT